MNESIKYIYKNAIEQTKIKVNQDINHYLEIKEMMPSIEDYLTDRGQYLQQIWINTWLNKVTSAVSKKDKKAYLVELGYEVEGVDKKLIKKLFRNAIREYEPFNVLAWLTNALLGREVEWKERYEKVRAEFLEKEAKKQLMKKKEKIKNEICTIAKEILEKEQLRIYLYVRHYVSRHLISDTEKYRIDEKTRVGDFFEETTRAILDHLFDFETGYYDENYFDVYENLVSTYLSEIVPKKVLKRLSEKIIADYEAVYREKLTESILKSIIYFPIQDLTNEFMLLLEEEYLQDFLNLAVISFDEKTHHDIYVQDTLERERRIEEEKREIERKKEEERRMIHDIFGQEYQASPRHHIHYVLHIGETNTGKTFHALERMKAANSGLYLAPLRLLALEVYDKLNAEGLPCSLKTGEEEKEVMGANHISCTVEMFHEKDFYDVIVIDEAQMLADKARGFSWYKAITKANANEVHIIGSKNIKNMLLKLLGDAEIEIHEYERDIPLEVETKKFNIKQTKKGDALVCFSRKRVLEVASYLENEGHKVSMIYGSMPPETRKKQIERFISGKTTVIVATDAIGMGLNLPIRRVVFLENIKFDGTRRRRLTSQEVKQIAGRAGRKGIYDVGKVAFTDEVKIMTKLLEEEDAPILMFAIAPTSTVFERFQKYSHNLGVFFELWNKFESPKGTKKASLSEERELYEDICNTEIEARLSLQDLYGFLHLPFSTNESKLKEQWRRTMFALVNGTELPEPVIKRGNLEELELSYKAIGLHLLFLYRLDRKTEAHYWERVREEISDGVHEKLRTEVKKMEKKCRNCGKRLVWNFPYKICDQCHHAHYLNYV